MSGTARTRWQLGDTEMEQAGRNRTSLRQSRDAGANAAHADPLARRAPSRRLPGASAPAHRGRPALTIASCPCPGSASAAASALGRSQLAVEDGHVLHAPAAQARGKLLGDDDAAVLAAGASERDGQAILALRRVEGQQ